MKNIWTGKRQGGRKKYIIALIPVCAAAAIMLSGLNKSLGERERYSAESVRSAIVKAAALCYASEGSYPENLEYLQDNYGISINDDKYTVHYGYVGGNIPPEVIVTVRKG
ncbi:MAG: hypothetical protein NC120_07495 [Ruminococcus sp.]|nr:hypothetical protein [Ruminococcus sp.]